MRIFGSKMIKPAESKSIQIDILLKFLLTALLSNILLIVLILGVSTVISEVYGREFFIDRFGVELFSAPYFVLLAIIFILGFFSSVIATIFLGLPFGRNLKNLMLTIRDANENFSRGKLGVRLDIKEYFELADISNQFNLMAARTEKQVESLQRLVNENKELIEDAEKAASSEERRKIARELHDAISQQLFAINTTLAAVPVLMDTKPDEAKHYLALTVNMVSNAQQELRALIMHLRPVSLEGYRLKDGIRKLLDELEGKNKNIRVTADLKDIEGVPQGVENNIFRVTQEAISNILRHSGAKDFSVKLYSKSKVLVLIIEDNGRGMSPGDIKKSSYGMATMRERIEEIGGRFDMISFPGRGTRIEIRVPIGLQGTFK